MLVVSPKVGISKNLGLRKGRHLMLLTKEMIKHAVTVRIPGLIMF